MHPKFRWFVEQIRATTQVEEIIVRSNLTIIMANKKYHDLPEFFKQQQVHVISSLPFYTRNKTDRQRGSGVFDQSIAALKNSMLLDTVRVKQRFNWIWFIIPRELFYPVTKLP